MQTSTHDLTHAQLVAVLDNLKSSVPEATFAAAVQAATLGCDVVPPDPKRRRVAEAHGLDGLEDCTSAPSVARTGAGAGSGAGAPAFRGASVQSGPQVRRKGTKRKAKPHRPFDMSKFRQRHVALHVCYLGHAYHGLAVQKHVEETIEHHLFRALAKTRMVTDRASSHYTRCGRTDAGVSALGQVIALRVRSKALAATPAGTAQEFPDVDSEHDYASLLNGVLPADIRVLGWAPVRDDFNARFATQSRTYRYFFVKRDMNIEHMRVAARLLEGTHDFRNLCKMDVVNVSNFVRSIARARVVPVHPGRTDRHSVWYIEISGNAFLWHQVRCMTAVLFTVGRELEEPEVVSALLDVGTVAGKPSYEMAPDQPLLLHASEYKPDDLHMRYSCKALLQTTKSLDKEWSRLTLKAAMIRNMLDSIDECQPYDPSAFARLAAASGPRTGAVGESKAAVSEAPTWRQLQQVCATDTNSEYCLVGKYKPLLERARGGSYEHRLATLSASKAARRLKAHPETADGSAIGSK